MVQAQLGVHLLQTTVFLFKLLEPLHIRGFHTAVFGLPVVIGRIGDAVLPTNLLDQSAAFNLFQDLDDLGLAVP